MTAQTIAPPVQDPADTHLISNWKAGEDPETLISHEWLVTNGLGGFSSGTVMGISSRKYHGLFVPNLPAPFGRIVMMPRFDIIVKIGNRTINLGGAEIEAGRVTSEAYRYLKEFKLVWQMPQWTFEIDGSLLEMRIGMPHGQNTVYVEFLLVKGEPVQLNLRPYLSFRVHDGQIVNTPDHPFTVSIKKGMYEVTPFEGAPTLRLGIRPQQGVFVSDLIAAETVYYRVEKERGLDTNETIMSPGYFSTELLPEKSTAFFASVEPWDSLCWDAPPIFEAEQRRLKKLLSQAPAVAQTGFPARLVLAADQFIILPGSRMHEKTLGDASGEHLRTVIAGYHWFTDWGRDTMISLEGLTLSTGRFEEAKAILRTFSTYVKDGLLPNLFPEGKRTGLYHTIDATLWFFHATDRYFRITNDHETLQLLYPTFESIIDWHVKGTDFGIGVDPADGLLRGGADGYALTWMDAKVDNWVVTPRRGKPVEVQALWYNALRIMSEWSAELDQPSEKYDALAKRAYESFNQRYWYEEGKYLYDIVDGEQGNDISIRPNQIFSFSLRFPILKEEHRKPVLDLVTEKLLTPLGLRTLDQESPKYHARYEGSLWARDSAYHQGMVWGWLIGPYLDAKGRVYGDSATNKKEFFKEFEHHMGEGGVGSISEIFDGTLPHNPRGCIAQAWSVAEVLRSYLK